MPCFMSIILRLMQTECHKRDRSAYCTLGGGSEYEQEKQIGGIRVPQAEEEGR